MNEKPLKKCLFLTIGLCLLSTGYSNAQTSIDRENDGDEKEFFEVLKESSQSADATAVSDEEVKLVSGMAQNSRILALVKRAILSQALDIVSGAIHLSSGQEVSSEGKVAMVSLPLSTVFAVTVLRGLSNKLANKLSNRFSFLKNYYKGGVVEVGKKTIIKKTIINIKRIPSLLLRVAFISAGLVVTDLTLSTLANTVLDVSVDDARALKEAIEEEIEEMDEGLLLD